MTYVGEHGWELYVPTEFAAGVWDRLVAAGESHGLALAGYYAINALRLDQGYRAWGAELGPDRTPLEAGLMFACKLATTIDFCGPRSRSGPTAGVLRGCRPIGHPVGR